MKHILRKAKNAEKITENLSERPKEYTQENIRHIFYNLLNPFVLGVGLVGGGNSLEQRNLVSNFKINNGIIYGDTLDIDNNIYSSLINMNLFQYRQVNIERLQKINAATP